MATSTIKLTPKGTLFSAIGNIVKSRSTGTAVGYGRANIIIVGGFVMIPFEAQIVTAGSVSTDYNVGISVATLQSINSAIPNITPWNSSMHFYKSTGEIDTSMEGYAGIASGVAAASAWDFGRYYNTSGNTGSWGDSKFTVGMRVAGILTGTLA